MLNQNAQQFIILLVYNFKINRLIFNRARSNHYFKHSRFDDSFHSLIEKRQFIRCDNKADDLALSWRKRDAFEPFQLFDWSRD